MSVPTREVECTDGNVLVEMSMQDLETLVEAASVLVRGDDRFLVAELLFLANVFLCQRRYQL